MDSLSAFSNAIVNKGRESMVFDWDKAAALIKERDPECARAGLADDWEWTGGDIFRDGKPVTDDYTYLSSTWATPELDLDGEFIECFVMQSKQPEWDSHTKWPESALNILQPK